MFKVEELTQILILLQRVQVSGAEANGFVLLQNKILAVREEALKEKKE